MPPQAPPPPPPPPPQQQQQQRRRTPEVHHLLRRAAPSHALEFTTFASNNPFKVLTVLLLLLSAPFLLRRSSSPSPTLCPSIRQSTSATRIPLPRLRFHRISPLPLLPGPTSSFRSPNWIIILSPPSTSSLLPLTRLQGWQLLAIADSHTPPDFSLRGAIFLSLDDQARLGYRSLDYLPYLSHLRKSAAYLFAIHHGARRILDFDFRSSPNPSSFYFPPSPTILRYLRPSASPPILNPYAHFGQRSVWPRGLPLESVAASAFQEKFFYSEIPRGGHFVQQGLTDGLPDVDSVFYFTRKARGEAFYVRFDREAPPIAVPAGAMIPMNSLNTLFHWEAFWGLMLPVSVSTMASDVIRGYWMQRLLWEIGGTISIHPPTATREDSAGGHPFSDERDLHVSVGRLVEFLVRWRSEKKTFFERVLDLSRAMAVEGFWKEKDVRFTADWLQDLIAVGYEQPKLVNWEKDLVKGVRREFVPRKLPSVHLGVEEEETVSSEIGRLVRWRKSFGNAVLIVYCTGSPDRTALEWRLLYGRIFKAVVILSDQKSDDLAVESADLGHAYRYLPKIFDRFPHAEGFLFLQDSMILNYWNLLQADKTRLWIADKAPGSWNTFSVDDGSQKWIKRQAALVKKVVGTMPVHFQVSYKESISEDKFVVCGSEIFYIPQHFVADFQDLVGLVGVTNLHHKVAVPLFFMAMDSPQNFDSDALKAAVYRPDAPTNASCLTYYSARAPAVYPCHVHTESEFIKLIRIMSTGDPLLMELV